MISSPLGFFLSFPILIYILQTYLRTKSMTLSRVILTYLVNPTLKQLGLIMASSRCRRTMLVDLLTVHLDVSSTLTSTGNLHIEAHGSHCLVLISSFLSVSSLTMLHIDLDVCLCCNCRGRAK